MSQHRYTGTIPSPHLQYRHYRCLSYSALLLSVFTARCYAERGYATVCRLSVRLSVCDVHFSLQVPRSIIKYRLETLNTGTSKIISRLNQIASIKNLFSLFGLILVLCCTQGQSIKIQDRLSLVVVAPFRRS